MLNPFYMSPVSPVFQNIKAVRIVLNSKGTNSYSPEIKISMLEHRALKLFTLNSYPIPPPIHILSAQTFLVFAQKFYFAQRE